MELLDRDLPLWKGGHVEISVNGEGCESTLRGTKGLQTTRCAGVRVRPAASLVSAVEQ